MSAKKEEESALLVYLICLRLKPKLFVYHKQIFCKSKNIGTGVASGVGVLQ